MNKLIRNLGITRSFSLKAIVTVDELTNHDMIYVYHHIQKGAVVNLKPSGTNLKGDFQYIVEFRDFKLGFITLSGPLKSFFTGTENLQAKVVAVSKDKFMIIKELDIQIGVAALKKVG